MRRVLVVGCGSIGRRHAENASRTASVTVTDISYSVADETARRIGAKVSRTLDEGLAEAPDSVVVATPHTTHLEVARRALDAGADVLVEKPLAPSPDGIAPFLLHAERLGRRVRVVCNMRFHPAIEALRASLPRVGKPLFVRAHYGNYLPDMRPGAEYRGLYCARASTGGGVILDAIHEIDYIAWLFGSVERVTAERGTIGDLDIDVEDYAALVLTHRSGVRSEIHVDYLQRSKRRGCEIVGSDGTLLWSSEGKAPERCTVRFLPPSGTAPETILDIPAVDGMEPYRKLMTAFLARGANDRDIADGRAGAECVMTAMAALRSANEGCAVRPETL